MLPVHRGGVLRAGREGAELRAVSPCCAALRAHPVRAGGVWRCPQMWSTRQAAPGRHVGTCTHQIHQSATGGLLHVNASEHSSQAEWTCLEPHTLPTHKSQPCRPCQEEHATRLASIWGGLHRGGGAKRVAPDWTLLSTWADKSSNDTSLHVRAHPSGMSVQSALIHEHTGGRAVP